MLGLCVIEPTVYDRGGHVTGSKQDGKEATYMKKITLDQ